MVDIVEWKDMGFSDGWFRCQVPVLLVWGTGDQVVTEAGHQLVFAAAKEGWENPTDTEQWGP